MLSTYGHDNNPNGPWDEFANEIEPCIIEFLKEMYPQKEPLMTNCQISIRYQKVDFKRIMIMFLVPIMNTFVILVLFIYQVNDSNFGTFITDSIVNILNLV